MGESANHEQNLWDKPWISHRFNEQNPGPESFDHPAGRLLRGAACAHLGSAGQSGVTWASLRRIGRGKPGSWTFFWGCNMWTCFFDFFFLVPRFLLSGVKWCKMGGSSYFYILLWHRMGAKLGKDGNGTMLRLGWTMIEWTAGPNIEGNPEGWCMKHWTPALQHMWANPPRIEMPAERLSLKTQCEMRSTKMGGDEIALCALISTRHWDLSWS